MLVPILLAIGLTVAPTEVVYSKAGGVELKLDIYRPTNNKSPGAAVLMLHGGAWMSGDRKWMAGLGKALAEEGFLAASASYRLAPGFKWPAMLHDAQTAVRYLRANANTLSIDPNRIGALGESAGGQLALLLGSVETRDKAATEFQGVSSKVQAVFDIYGPTDLESFPRSMDAVYHIVLGKPRDQAIDLIREASPMRFISASSAPTFILHGTEDPMVPLAQSESLKTKLRSFNVPHEAAFINGMGHRIDGNLTDVRTAIRRGIEFLRLHLGEAATKKPLTRAA